MPMPTRMSVILLSLVATLSIHTDEEIRCDGKLLDPGQRSKEAERHAVQVLPAHTHDVTKIVTGKFMTFVRFENGRVKAIKFGEYGF